MKRLIPIVIVICLLGVTFVCLPKNTQNRKSLTSLEELNGCKVGVQTGTNYESLLQDSCPDAEPVFFSEFQSIYPALQQGKIDAMLTETLSYAVEKMEIPSLAEIDGSLGELKLRVGVAKTSRANSILKQINDFITQTEQDGSLDELKSYWVTNYDRENATVDKSGITGENGTVVFAGEASFEPSCFAGKNGELSGFSIDFIYRFCRAYGYQPEIQPLSYDSMVAALASNKIDVAVGVLADEERAEEVCFSEPFMLFDIIAVYDTGESDGNGFWINMKNSFTKTFIRDARWKMFLSGTGTTLLLAVLSVLFGTVFGLLLYMWCAHGKKAEQRITDVLCWIMGSTPTIVLLMILYYVIFGSYTISNIVVAVIGFSILFGCGFYEMIVSGLHAVGTGQEEAARAQGFSADQTFFRILLPQAAVHFMPAYQNAVISLIQETSVVGYIAVMDLTKMSDMVRGRTYEPFFPLLATAGIYFLIIWIMTMVIHRIAGLVNTRKRKRKRILKDIKTN